MGRVEPCAASAGCSMDMRALTVWIACATSHARVPSTPSLLSPYDKRTSDVNDAWMLNINRKVDPDI